jgi:hypothetical protein
MWLLRSSARRNSEVFGAEVIVLLESGSGVRGFDVVCYLLPVGNVLPLAGPWLSATPDANPPEFALIVAAYPRRRLP